MMDNVYGLEQYNIPISRVRIHKTDNRWLVEYRKRPTDIWKFWDRFWWYNDGRYVSFRDAHARAQSLVKDGYVTGTRTMRAEYIVEEK